MSNFSTILCSVIIKNILPLIGRKSFCRNLTFGTVLINRWAFALLLFYFCYFSSLSIYMSFYMNMFYWSCWRWRCNRRRNKCIIIIRNYRRSRIYIIN